MTIEKLEMLFNELGLSPTLENNRLRGKTYRYVFHSWINTKEQVTIKTRGVQKSFDINDIVVYMDDSDVVIKISDGKSIKNVIGKVIGLYRKI